MTRSLSSVHRSRPFAALATGVIATSTFAQPPTRVAPSEGPLALLPPGVPSDQVAALAEAQAAIARLRVRDGWVVEAAIPRIDGARFMALAPDGRLYVSRPRFNDIVVALDLDGDGLYEAIREAVGDVPGAHGLCWAEGALWFSLPDTICSTRDENNDGVPEGIIPVVTDLPAGGMHWWRSVLVHDGHIYTSVGDSGNIEDESATDRQKIWRYKTDGSEKTLFASGIRNSEKLLVRPGEREGAIWGVDHGSDWFGIAWGENEATGQPITDLNPPDELNRYTLGGFYGHPFLTGNRVPRNEYKDREDLVELAARTIPPQWQFEAHAAANGFTFVDPGQASAKHGPGSTWVGDAVVACRGSWNRSDKAGYSVVRVIWDKDPVLGGRPSGNETLVSTIDAAGEVVGRPVDVVQASDGSFLFSVDVPQGRVYRIRPKQVEMPAEGAAEEGGKQQESGLGLPSTN